MTNGSSVPSPARWQRRLHEVVFESDTFAGKAFDLGVLLCIGASVLIVILDSVPHIRADYGSGCEGCAEIRRQRRHGARFGDAHYCRSLCE